jgi:hypothetical protein
MTEKGIERLRQNVLSRVPHSCLEATDISPACLMNCEDVAINYGQRG